MENNLPPIHPPPPPGFTPRPPWSPGRGGRGWMIVAVILGLMLGLLILADIVRSSLNWSVGSRTGRQSGRWLDETLVENNGSSHKIAIVDVEGIISSMSLGRRG